MEVSIVGFLAGLELAGLVWMKWRSIVCADHGSHVPELASIRFEVGLHHFMRYGEQMNPSGLMPWTF